MTATLLSEATIDQENQAAWDNSRIDTNKALSDAISILDQSNELAYEKGIADGHRTIAHCYWLLGILSDAVIHLDIALPLYQKLQLPLGEAEILNIYGAVSSNLGDYDKAISYYEYALNIRKELNDEEGIVKSMNSIGDSYMKLEDYPKALSVFERIISINHNNLMFKGIVLYNISEVNCHLDKLEKAAFYLNQCQEIGETLDFDLMKIYCHSLFGKIAIKEQDYANAKTLLNKALKLSKNTNNKERTYNILSDLADLHERIGEYELALQHYKEYQALKESTLTSENLQKLKTLEQKLETERLIQETELEKSKNAELSHAYNEIEINRNKIAHQNKEITQSIMYAQRIQNAILPSEQLVKSIFPESFVIYKPKDVLSGDFYWVSEVKTITEDKFLLAAVADATGHGIPGALMSLIGNNYLRLCERTPEVNTPAEALDFINNGLSNTLRQDHEQEAIRDGMDISFIALDYKEMKLYFAGAKSNIFISRNGKVTRYRGDAHPVGVHITDELKKFTNQTIDIEKGDMIYLSTDGYVDQFGGPLTRKFMQKQFIQTISEIDSKSINEQRTEFDDRFYDWKGVQEQTDDVCVMGIRV